jgi:hypothetical protein
MYRRASSMIAAGIWAMALSAQTPPLRFPGVPQFTVTPPPAAARQEATRALRQLLKSYSQEEAAMCSIPLLEAPVEKNAERMPVLRPRAEPDNIDDMPSVKLPAPPCKEEKR